MAIKFSQFTVRTNSSDLSHIVGYNGVDNIQITPTNFLNSALTGTAGQVLFYDTTGVAGDNDLYWDNINKRLGIGTNSPTQTLDVDGAIITEDYRAASIFYLTSGDDWRFRSATGSERMRITSGGNVGIGTSSPSEKLEVVGNIKVGDSQSFLAGASDDLKILHNGTFSSIQNNTGDLKIINYADDEDIVFESDNGSGGTAEYFRLDGSLADGTNTFTKFADNSWITMGNGGDLLIGHQTTSSKIENYTGPLYIVNKADDQDIIFQSDDGSGGIDTYFSVVGAGNRVQYNKNLRLIDNVKATFGSDDDLQIYHTSGVNIIDSTVGDLIVKVSQDDGDIIFQSDNGSGGIDTYFRLDGGQTRTEFEKATQHLDNVIANFGSSSDLQVYHNGTDSYILNGTGDLEIINNQDDGDIIFKSDNGSGGNTPYFKLWGAISSLAVYKDMLFVNDGNNGKLKFGASQDLEIYHDGSNSFIRNTNTNLIIKNEYNDGDIIFESDDGSGNIAEYFRLDGGITKVVINKDFVFEDSIQAQFGSGADLQIYHNGTNSIVDNNTGDLIIRSDGDDIKILAEDDVVIRDNDDSTEMAKFINGGAVELYFNGTKKLETTSAGIDVSGQVSVNDYLVHNGDTNTYLGYSGADAFELVVGGTQKITADSNAAYLRYQGTTTLQTRGTGIKITGVSEYADNTAAIAGGLTTGDVYRTGDLLKIVH